MQFLASINNSEQWQKIADLCQLPSLNKVKDLKELEKGLQTESSNVTEYCIRTPLSLADVSELLATPEIKLVLCIDSPETLIGKQLELGQLMRDALNIWHSQILEVLHLQQQHRRQILLVQTNSLLINPLEAPDWVTRSFSTTLQADLGTKLENTQLLSNNFYQLMASQALRQNPETESTWQRLIASCLPLVDEPYLIFDLDALQKTAIDYKDQKLLESKEENELLEQQLFLVQEKLEQQLHKNQTIELECQALEQQKLALKKQYTQLDSVYQDEVAGLIAKLQKAEQNNQVLSQKNTTLQSYLEEQKADLESATDAHKNTEEKVLECKDENELLTQQLLQAQEELEENSLKLQQSTATYSQFKQRSQQAQIKLELKVKELTVEKHATNIKLSLLQQQGQEELEQLKKQIEDLNLELALASYKLVSTQVDLNAITESKLWKGVSPVRKFVSLLKRKDPTRVKLQSEVDLIMSSEYFDLAWYVSKYSDVAESGVNPAEHYLLHGATEGRLPGPNFDGNWYLSQYSDVAESNINPLLHYILFGAQEGRSTSLKLLPHLAAVVADNVQMDSNTDIKSGKESN